MDGLSSFLRIAQRDPHPKTKQVLSSSPRKHGALVLLFSFFLSQFLTIRFSWH